MISRLSAFTVALAIFLSLSLFPGVLHSEEVTQYELRTASFSVPSDWTETMRKRDREYDFQSSDKRFELWVRWWFPDEPLLGGFDVVRHQKLTLAGQDALFLHVGPENVRFLELAFLKPNDEGEQLLFQLIGHDVSLSEHEAMFGRLLQNFSVEGRPVKVKLSSAASFDGTGMPAPTEVTQTTPPGGAPLPGQEWLTELNKRFDGGCVLLPLDGWDGPDRRALAQADVAVEFRAECGAQAHPVYGVQFKYDLRGATDDYFYPLYDNFFAASGQTDFGFIEVKDHLLVDLTIKQPNEMVVDLIELSSPDQSPLGEASVAKGADDTGGAVSTVLFDGNSLDNWATFEFEGGNFDSHAQLGGGMLLFEIPEGSGWAKTGLRTTQARVTMPKRDASEGQVISVTLDADRSTGILIALAPTEEAEEDPWFGHTLRLILARYEDEMVRATLSAHPSFVKQRENFAWPKGIITLEIVLRPDQAIELRRQGGARLAWFDLDRDFGGRELVLQVYAQPPHKNGSGSLALQRVELAPAPVAQLPDIDGFADAARQVVLFDGTEFAPIWTFVEYPGTPSEPYARLSDGAMRVSWPEGAPVRHLGMYSQQPMLWLDEFGPKAVARINVELDGKNSADFELGLNPSYHNHEDAIADGAYFVSFRRQSDGSFLFQSGIRSEPENILEQTGLVAIPDTITLVLTSRGVAVDAEGVPADPVPYKTLQSGVGLRMWLYATPPAKGAAALVVKRIEAAYAPTPKRAVPAAVAGVAPLPQRVLFQGRPLVGWTPASAGAEMFEDLAEWSDKGLVLTRPDAPKSVHRIALISEEPVVVLDHRIEETAFETQFQVIPGQDNFGMRVLFSTWPNNQNKGTVFRLTLRNASTGAGGGRLRVTLHSDHFYYHHWTRLMPAGWEGTWDGVVTVGFAKDRTYVRLGDTKILSTHTSNSRKTKKFHVVVLPGGPDYQSGQVTLQQIRTGWKTPPMMDPMERLLLVDTDAFDPKAYADLLAQELVTQ